ncbi:MAG: ATP-binding protein [Planctomycetota bacterium]
METVRMPLVVVNANGRVHECNAAFQAALGLEDEDIVDDNFFELAGGEFDTPRVRELFRDLVERDLHVHDVVVTQSSERFGRRVYLFSASSVTLPNDAERYLLLSIEDVTAAHDALRRRTEEVEQFAYSVSHDMKSPLVSVLGFVGLAHEELERGNPAEARALLGRITSSAQRMSALIDDLLRLVQIGRADPRDETLDLARLIQELIDTSLSGPIAAARAQVVLEAGLPRVRASRSYMNQTFSNLLGNALQYGCPAPGATIRVGGRPAAGGYRIFVRDEGPGVPEEYQERIFGLFQRLGPSRNSTGIGLAIVAKIMDLYKGRAWVESADGKGATFWIFLPSERVLEQTGSA